MQVRLNSDDFDRLVRILSTLPDFATVQGRVDFVTDVFAGSPRRYDIVTLINLDGSPRSVAVRLVDRLQTFGQDEPGRETLGVLVNKALHYIGGGDEADYLRGLFDRYPFETKPSADRYLLADWRGRDTPEQVQEKIIGENTLRDISMLEIALAASRAVVRITTPFSLGTGFMITEDLLVTNHHVIADAPTAQQSTFFFNYQVDRFARELPSQACSARAEGLFWTNPELDYSVIELVTRDLKEEIIGKIEHLPLKRVRVQRDERVNIIQHPGGHYKKISMQNNFVAYADNIVVQYTTATEPGSSGAPVCNNAFEVIAVHHSGGMLPEPGTQRRYMRNAGTSTIAVLEDLQRNRPQIAERLQG